MGTDQKNNALLDNVPEGRVQESQDGFIKPEHQGWRILKIWWRHNGKYIWLIIFVIFVGFLWNALSYLPILFPDRFTESPQKTNFQNISPVTIYSPKRIMGGHEYEIVVRFDPPPMMSQDSLYGFETDWKDSIITPSTLQFNGGQIGPQKAVLTLDIEQMENIPNTLSVKIKQLNPPPLVENHLEIKIVKLPDYLIQLVVFFTVFGALILKFVSPAITVLWKNWTKKPNSQTQED
jgi:hypothetical protein